MQLPFSFDRLSVDGRTAFFNYSSSNEIDQDDIFSRIAEISPEVVNDGNHIVRIRGLVHDIYIPDLKVDNTSKEVSFDWLNLFSLFFAEEKVYRGIMQRWVSSPAEAFSQ